MPEQTTGGTALIVAMVLAYMVLASWLTFRFRAKSSSDFMVASRSVPALVIGVLMMSEFIAPKSTIGVAQAAFESGMAAAWGVLSVALGFVIFGWVLARKLYESGEYTISAAIAKTYGRSTQMTVSLIMIYALLLVNVAFYVAGAAALSSVFHISLAVASVLIASISTLYCVIGGQKSAAYVSVLHTAMKCLGVAIVLAVALHMTGGISPMMAKLPSAYFTWDGRIGLTTLLAWTIASIGSIFSTQYIMQAISSLPGPQDVRKACLTSAILCVPVSIALGLIGVAAKFLFPDLKSLYAFPVFLKHMPIILSGLVTVSVVASILVGVNSVGLATSSLIVRDFYVPLRRPTPEAELLVSRLLSIPVGFLPLIFVFFVPEILHLSFFTRALRLSISVVAIGAFYMPGFCTNRGATLGLVTAAIATTAWFLMGDPFGIDDIYVALIAPAFVMGLDHFAAKYSRGSSLTPQAINSGFNNATKR